MSVVIETTLGDLTVDLFVQERPQTCLNFLKLCKHKYYNLCLFHSVNANFCAQTGDPTGKGDGGESIHGLIRGSEFRFYQGETQPRIKHDRTGLLSMVSHGEGMLGSQFVITLSPNLDSLDGEHVVFGEVVEGSEVLLKLNEAITDVDHRPYQDIRITHTVILQDPFPDPKGLGDPPPSPVGPSTKDIAYSRIPADEPVEDTCTQQELDEMVQAREASARATILEMVGDLPSADVAPPENVLFVCKLNPVTTDHDLSIIFSRFGKVKNCEVIRDTVSGDSLQYAFVEFENQKSCEEAYFKMDNVLIDDRRIHVDFSQSVAKWRGKGKGVEMFGPPPPGGWGNKSKRGPQKDERRFQREDRGMMRIKEEFRDDRSNSRDNRGNGRRDSRDYIQDDSGHDRGYDRQQRYRNEQRGRVEYRNEQRGREEYRNRNVDRHGPLVKNKVIVKKQMERKKKRRSPSSSSSTSSTSSDASSDSSSSESEPRKKKSRRRTDKVLVVVKTPRAKVRKPKSRTKKYESDSDDRVSKRKKKKRPRSEPSDSSEEESYKVKKKKKKQEFSEDEAKQRKKRKKKDWASSSEESSSEEEDDDEDRRKDSKKKKRKNDSEDDRKSKRRKKDGESKKKRKVVKNGSGKRKKQQQDSSDSDSASSSD